MVVITNSKVKFTPIAASKDASEKMLVMWPMMLAIRVGKQTVRRKPSICLPKVN